jgi:ParB-like nuclease domain
MTNVYEEVTMAFYQIEKLLSQSVQPFDDLTPDEFEVMRESIRDRGLLNPILLTSDGYLFDGHQRCKALLSLGRKRMAAKDVRIQSNVTRDNMLGFAYATNLVRRMLTTEQKVERMHACVKLGWSQRRIAKEFHVTQPAVSQLMAAYPLEDGAPEVLVTHGEDGKTYTRMPRPPRLKAKPWQYYGIASKQVRTVHKLIATELPTGLTESEKAEVAEQLEALGEAIDTFLTGMETM